MKVRLAEKSFSRPDELLDVISAFLEESQRVELKIVFHHWMELVK
jgi:hypothetical protein